MNKYFFISKGKIKSKLSANQGFALIATITLMVLLALLSIGLLTIAASQTRISEKGIFAAEAKAQARLAMEVAIGRLQCELGPDQRISANSGIMDSSPDSETIDGVACPYVLGAWDSWDTWMNRKNSSGKKLTDTYERGRKELFRRWLISTSDKNNDSSLTAATDNLGAYNAKNERKVQLLGTGTLGKNTDKKQEIYAALVQVDDANSPRGPVGKKKSNATMKSIAWWVSGENQKARINMPQFKWAIQDDIEIMRGTWDTPTPDMTVFDGLDRMKGKLPSDTSEEYDNKIRSLISFDTMGLLNANSSGDPQGTNYHRVSMDSVSILTDVKFGGLKKDLNILLSQEELPEDFKGTNADIGLRPKSSEDGSATEENRPISSWNQLYQWANLWDSTISQGQDNSAKLQWTGQSPFTLIASDADGVSRMMNNRYTYVRQPILLKMYVFTGAKLAPSVRGVALGGRITTSLFETPVFVWWNPYNVSLQMKGANEAPWGSNYTTHRVLPLLYSHNSAGRQIYADDAHLEEYSESFFTPFYTWKNHQVGGAEYPHFRTLHDYGASYRKTAKINNDGKVDKGDITTLAAGEIIMFSLPAVPGNWDEGEGWNAARPVSVMRASYMDAYPDAIPLTEGWEASPDQVYPSSFVIDWGMRYDVMKDGQYPDGCKYPGYAGPKFKIQRLKFADTSDAKTPPGGGLPSFITPEATVLAHTYTEEYTQQNHKLGPFMMASGVLDDSKYGTQLADVTSGAKGNDQNIQWLKANPAVLNLNWGVAGKVGWDNVYMDANLWIPDSNASEKLKREGMGRPNHDRGITNEFLSYHGVSIKWGIKPLLAMPRTGNLNDRSKENYQAKIWQHSSPLFWGGQIIEPSDLACSYSPYQFEYRQGKGMDKLDLPSVLSTDGSKSAPFGGPGSEQVTNIVATELPLHPPYSLAGFANFRLTPGWYDSGGGKAQIAKRFAYQSGVPGVGIGNAFADPIIPATEIFSHNSIAGDDSLGDFWDHGLMVNDGLWDSWFTSSLSSRPQSLTSGGKAEPLESVVKKVYDKSALTDKTSGDKSRTQLANKRFSPIIGTGNPDNISKELTDKDGYKKSARYMQQEGGFNVNSSNYLAWKAIMSGLKDRRMMYMDQNGTPKELTKDKNTTFFSRFSIASANQSHVDDMGSTGVMNGYPIGEFMSWTDLRKIDDDTIDKISKEIVSQVKQRGPFLNLSEFINRRLVDGDLGIKGALQTAIDKSGANSVFDGMKQQYIDPKAEYPNKEAAKGSYYTAAPGYLIQSDVLAVLGNILTTRDDTFKIRAYGEVSDKSQKTILSRAWCEAIVRRGIDYVDPIDSPETSAITVDYKTGALTDSKLSKINKTFGRKFEVVSFRWLSSEEI
ncbi:MAG: hypothetical protein RR250_01725 [Akkermansia sp.]